MALARWMPWYHAQYGRADVERWFAEADRMWQERIAFPMAIVESADRRLLGGVGLHDIQLYGKREAEMGYWVRRTACGQGVAATAIRAMAAFGVNELGLIRRVDAHSARQPLESARGGASGRALRRRGAARPARR